MAQCVQLVSSSSSCGSIQAAQQQQQQQRRPASASAIAANCGQGRGPVGSAHISMKNRLLLPRRDADIRLIKGSSGWGFQGKQQAAMVTVVRASSTIGVVTDVRTEVEGIYYNVTLRVPLSSDVARWYQIPGQFVDLLPTNSAQENSASFFIASPVKCLMPGSGEHLLLEFLVQKVRPDSVADQLIDSKPGDCVSISTNDFSHGFSLPPIRDAESILMFASSYGLGPMRAFIETTKISQSNERKHAILYTMFAPKQEPYKHKHPAWEQSGVTVTPFENRIENTDPAKTVVLITAFEDEQESLINCFKKKGVPHDQILTLFDGIPRTADKTYINKVLGKPGFLHMGEQYVPFALKI